MTADQPRPALVEFLLARLGEDEAVARAATPGPWHKIDGGVTDLDGAWPVAETDYDGDDRDQADREHIARHDPARVLAEVEAKRRIIARMTMLRGWHPGDPVAVVCADGTLRALALPYADHPDYDERWRP